MGKMKKNQIRVSFVGNNAEHVTGSMTLIETKEQKILIECGLVQGESTLLENYKANTQKFKFHPKDISSLIICHCHADHLCLVPRLYAQGCEATIYAPIGSKKIAEVLLRDSAYIFTKDVDALKRKTGKDYQVIYTNADIDKALSHWVEIPIGDKVPINDDLTLQFVGSGHIINACQAIIHISSGNNAKKILYTSDLGTNIKKCFVQPFEPVDKANIVIGESTYADNRRNATRKDRKNDLLKIESIIREFCIEKKGKVLIPSFALDRTQWIIYVLYTLFKDNESCPTILVDSPMAVKLCKLYLELLNGDDKNEYEKAFHWDKIKYIESYDDSKMYQMSKEPLICVASAGMLNAGRSVVWASKLLPNPNNCILFVGYSANNSLASRIKEGKTKTISIDGKPIANRCQIVDLKSFSSHLNHEGLLKYYSDISCEKICLVHGEFKYKCEFAKELQDEISKKNKTTKVVIVNNSTEICL